MHTTQAFPAKTENSSSPSIFLSYSRQQLYYAEAVAIELKKAGLNVWFDLHELEAGTDWQREITEGLQQAAALVLVASQAALVSPWVAQEWQAALAQEKPVYVIACEDVVLPPALEDVTVIDGRRNFDRALKRVIHCIREGETARDEIPKPNRLNLPTRLPWSIRIILATILFFMISTLGFAIRSVATGGTVILVLPLLVVLLCLWMCKRLLDHTIGIGFLLWGLGGLLFFAPMAIAFTYAIPETMRTAYDLTLIIVLMLILLAASVFCVLISPATLRWLPPGKAGKWRRKLTYGQLFREKPLTAKRQQFQLYADSCDRGTAKAIRRRLVKAGHTELKTTDTERPADFRLLVLSGRTSAQTVQRALASGEPIVTVIASPVEIPPEFAAIEHYQAVDYRKRQPDILRQLTEMMNYEPTFVQSSQFTANPRPWEHYLLPDTAQILLYLWRALALIFLFICAFILVAVLVFAVVNPAILITENEGNNPFVVGLQLILALLAFLVPAFGILFLIQVFQAQQATERQFLGLTTLCLLLSPFIWIYAADPALRGDLPTVLALVYGTVFMLLATRWLPTGKGSSVFRVHYPVKRYWRNNLIAFLLLVFCTLIFFIVTLEQLY